MVYNRVEIETRRKFSMEKRSVKTIGMTLLLLITFLATCLVFNACSSGKKDLVFESSTDLFGFAGATAGEFLATLELSQSNLVASNAPTMEQVNHIDKLNKYVDIFESVVGNKAITSKKETLTEGDYNYKITTTLTNLQGEKKTFLMKFREVKTDNTEVKNDDEDEIETRLDGVMVFDNVEYRIVGEKSVERDEIEVEFCAYIDEQNYVEISQSLENDEREFEYSIYQNGALIDSMSVEIENERKELEIELVFQDNNSEKRYEFERKGNSLIISYEDENGKRERITAIVSSNGENITYTFTDGNIITKTRN